jgi:SdiA-regulated
MMTWSPAIACFGCVLTACAPIAGAQAPFPGAPGVNIGQNLPFGFEGSGAVYHPRLDRLFIVGDSGVVASIEKDGGFYSQTIVGGDLEGITYADPNSNFLYLALENPDSVLEFDVVAGVVTRAFDVSAILTGSANLGVEAMTFVPDANDLEGGLFHLGQQSNGRVYVFRLPIVSSATATTFTLITSYVPVVGLTDIAGLEYDRERGRLYAIYDANDRLVEMTTAGAVVNQWVLPGTDQEGIAIDGCELFTTDDMLLQIWKHHDFPSLADCHSFSQQTTRISATSGGVAPFVLRAQAPVPPLAGRLVLGSASGSVPPLAIGVIALPLVPDGYFQLTATNANSGPFVATLGAFDALGRSTAALAIPPLPPAFVGLSLTHAYLAFNPVTHAPIAASSADTLTIVP